MTRTQPAHACAGTRDGGSRARGTGGKENPVTQLLVDRDPTRERLQLLKTESQCRAQLCLLKGASCRGLPSTQRTGAPEIRPTSPAHAEPVECPRS